MVVWVTRWKVLPDWAEDCRAAERLVERAWARAEGGIEEVEVEDGVGEVEREEVVVVVCIFGFLGGWGVWIGG